jgi:hypothetical protein
VNLRALFRRLPLIGRLSDCRFEDHWRAIQEIFTVQALSSMPIWLGTYIAYVTAVTANTTVLKSAFFGTIWNGELFIYSTSLCAPLFWMALNEPRGSRAFPHRLAHGTLIALIVMFAAASFGVRKAGAASNPTSLFNSSVVLVCISLSLRYLGTVYNNLRARDASAEIKAQEDNFASRVQEHRP